MVGKLRAFNEIQHKIMSQVIPMLMNNPNRYPDEVFFSILHEIAQDADFVESFDSAIEKTVKRVD